MPRTLGLVGATTLAFALLAPTAAQADTWGSSDPSGDVRGVRSDPDPAPCGTDTVLDASNETNVDITALGVRHTRRSVVVTTRFRDIVAEHEHHLTFSIRTPKEKFEYDVYRSDPRSGEWQIFSLLFVHRTTRPRRTPVPAASSGSPSSVSGAVSGGPSPSPTTWSGWSSPVAASATRAGSGSAYARPSRPRTDARGSTTPTSGTTAVKR
jgi:hypothetical protein